MKRSEIYLIAGIVITGILLAGRKLMVGGGLERMAEAMKQFEGWYEGSVSWRNNNPGNLKFRNQAGTVGRDEYGHAIFDSYESGWQALLNQLRLAVENKSANYHNSDSLYAFFSKYSEANSVEYARFVAMALGVSPETSIGTIAQT